MRKDRILQILRFLAPPGAPVGVTAEQVAQQAGVQRQNASADLNELCREGLARKSGGRPVRFWATTGSERRSGEHHASFPSEVSGGFEAIVGHDGSLRSAVEQAKAAMLYPPNGLPTLIVGPTGSGKSLLAEVMYRFAQQAGRLRSDAPFLIFNCADYASNPQLLLAHLFGHTRGAFTGAERESEGLVAGADGGVLFLDEIHRLPPEGQEMLFVLMDRGVYRALGDSTQRRSRVTLIAATSEDPKSTLLATFLRRFPVVLTLPDLEQRPLEERLALVERFFREEAARVGIPISVGTLALVALLCYRTMGNVGELRSAVLLGCAKAFLNHVASGADSPVMPVYLTHLAPEIQLAYLSGGEACWEAERLIGLEDRIYEPAAPALPSVHGVHDAVPPDMYADLRRRLNGYVESGLQPWEVQQLIQTDVEYYLRRLLQRSGGRGHVSPRLLQAVSRFVEAAGEELGRSFEPEVVSALALHLASRHPGEGQDAERAVSLVPHCPREYGVVRRLVPLLERDLQVTLTPGEITFLALFLAAHGRAASERAGVRVLVVAHGEGTASSMAAVANRLLGSERVHAVDMPLEQSVEATLEKVIETARSLNPSAGLMLLVDMGSLTGFGSVLQQALGIPVRVVPLVTTAAVIEAGRLAGEPDVDLATVAEAVRIVYQPAERDPVSARGKRMIITTCLTGQGTARKLAAFLHEALPHHLRDQVTVQPVDLENGSPLPELLVEGWRGSVVAAAGTVDPHIPNVPFIGMEQILFGEGLKALVALAAGEEPAPDREAALSRDEAIELASRFVAESISSLDGSKAAETAVRSLVSLERRLERVSSPSQAARWVIHFAFTLERLVEGGPSLTCSELSFLQEHHGGLLETIAEVVDLEAARWQVHLTPDEIGFFALIVLST